MKHLNTFFNAFLAGMFVAIGGTVYISLSMKDLAAVGAVLFSTALISISILELYLYTGKIGYIVTDHRKNNIIKLAIGLLGNFIGAFVFGLVLSRALPAVHEYAVIMCNKKLNLDFFSILILSTMCGILMYTAVEIYKRKNSIVGIVFCIPVFILSGFEHSIADMFYFSVAGSFSFKSVAFVITVIIGNSIGGMFIPLIKKLKR